MNTRLVFATIFVPIMILLGELIHAQGRKLLSHAFGTDSQVGSAVSVLLRIGWYLTSVGLLLWNLGIEPAGESENLSNSFTEVSLRLGVSLFVVGLLHGINLLAVSLFHRKNTD